MKILTLKKVVTVSLLLTFLLALVILFSVMVGSVRVDPVRSISILLQSLLGLQGTETEMERTIILSLRFPRALLAGLVGAGLSVSGVIFQALLRNPLADPYILGVSSGAAVGAIIAILMGLEHPLLRPPSCLVRRSADDHCPWSFYFGRQEGKIHPNTLLLAGVITELLSLCHHHVLYFHLPEGGTPYHHLLVDGRLQLCQSPRRSGMILPYIVVGFLLLYFSSPVKPDPFGRGECPPIGSECGAVEDDLLSLCLSDHGGLCLRVRSDRFRGPDRSPFGSTALRA